MALFDVPFSPPRCPRCSSKVTDQSDDHMTFLCGTELVLDNRDDAWEHDWSEDANKVCEHIGQLRDQIGQLEGLEATVGQLRTALAFAASAIRGGEPWTAMCDEMIGGALAASKPVT